MILRTQVISLQQADRSLCVELHQKCWIFKFENFDAVEPRLNTKENTTTPLPIMELNLKFFRTCVHAVWPCLCKFYEAWHFASRGVQANGKTGTMPSSTHLATQKTFTYVHASRRFFAWHHWYDHTTVFALTTCKPSWEKHKQSSSQLTNQPT